MWPEKFTIGEGAAVGPGHFLILTKTKVSNICLWDLDSFDSQLAHLNFDFQLI